MKRIFYDKLLPLVILCSFTASYSQQLPRLQPEQDVCGALTICNGLFFTPYSYVGVGQKTEQMARDVVGGACHNENNSVWFRIEVATAGDIVFEITPLSDQDDYDFTIYNGTGRDCSTAISDDTRIRSNGNTITASEVVVGLDYNSTKDFVSAGTRQNNFLRAIHAAAGDVYFILVDNYYQNVQAGFTINFAGSTATFKGEPAPEYKGLTSNCDLNASGFTIHMSSVIMCRSIAADGSDFSIIPAVPGLKMTVTGINCMSNTGYTRDIAISFNQQLPPGNYTLKSAMGTDGNTLLGLCDQLQQQTDALPFRVSEPLRIDASADITTCSGTTIPLEVTIQGGRNNQVQWRPDQGMNENNAARVLVTPAAGTIYTVTVTPDGLTGCAKEEKVEVKLLQEPEVQRDTTICKGQSFKVRATGDPAFSYQWSPAAGISAPGTLSPVITPSASADYTLTATYTGCADRVYHLISTVALPPLLQIGADTSICIDSKPTMHVTVIPAGTSILDYSWKPASVFDKASDKNPQFTGSDTTMITLEITTTTGCHAGSPGRKIKVYKPTLADAGTDIITTANTPVQLHGAVSDPLALISWSPAHHITNANTVTPTVQTLAAQQYQLTAINGGGCVSHDSVWVKIYGFSIPNIFTPNGDGINDVWIIPGLEEYDHVALDIFNRWGQSVYRSTGYKRPWNGTSGGVPLPAGIYYYVIRPNVNNYAPLTGAVTIIR